MCTYKDYEVKKIIYIYKAKHDAPDRFAGFSVLDVGLAGV